MLFEYDQNVVQALDLGDNFLVGHLREAIYDIERLLFRYIEHMLPMFGNHEFAADFGVSSGSRSAVNRIQKAMRVMSLRELHEVAKEEPYCTFLKCILFFLYANPKYAQDAEALYVLLFHDEIEDVLDVLNHERDSTELYDADAYRSALLDGDDLVNEREIPPLWFNALDSKAVYDAKEEIVDDLINNMRQVSIGGYWYVVVRD